MRLGLLDLEGSMVMSAGKQSASNDGVESGRRIAPRDEDSLLLVMPVVPHDRDPVSCVFGRDPDRGREARWSDVS
jgi:hypothetical protein